MSLKNILLDITSVLGIDVTSQTEREYYIVKINEAADEIYRSQDLPGSIREQIFQISDVDNYQVSFPGYIDKIRAIRFWDSHGGKISTEDLRPRYHQNRWGNSGFLKFRIKRSNSPIAKDIENAAPITFSLPSGKVETSPVVINIVGRTAASSGVQETITIAAGASSEITVNAYEEILSIEKTAYNTYDIELTDVDGEVLGSIPNNELSPLYTIVQIRQDDYAPTYNDSFPLNTIEVLYKTKFVPFRNLYDEFPCPNCDKLIFWKFAEHYAAYKPGMEQRAFAAKAKCDQIINELTANDEQGKELVLEIGSNSLYDAQMARGDRQSGQYPYQSEPWIQYTGSN